MDWLLIGYWVGGIAALVVGGDLLVRGASRLAGLLGISPMVIGLTVVAFGTSTPELAVSLEAALKGNANIAIANVVGSNIFNVLFILGVSALIAPLLIHSTMIRREVPIMIAVSGLFWFFCRDLNIVFWEALVLFGLIIAYTAWLVIEARQQKAENAEIQKESEIEYGKLKTQGPNGWVSTALIIFGLGIVMLGADWLIKGAVQTAQFFGISDTIIGLTIVAAGTSLPEVVASIMATLKGERDIAVGNVIGSNIYNILAIIGLSGLVVPSGIQVDPNILAFDLPVMFGVALLCLPFFKTGKTLSRLEGCTFLALYVGYTVYLIQTATA